MCTLPSKMCTLLDWTIVLCKSIFLMLSSTHNLYTWHGTQIWRAVQFLQLQLMIIFLVKVSEKLLLKSDKLQRMIVWDQFWILNQIWSTTSRPCPTLCIFTWDYNYSPTELFQIHLKKSPKTSLLAMAFLICASAFSFVLIYLGQSSSSHLRCHIRSHVFDSNCWLELWEIPTSYYNKVMHMLPCLPYAT